MVFVLPSANKLNFLRKENIRDWANEEFCSFAFGVATENKIEVLQKHIKNSTQHGITGPFLCGKPGRLEQVRRILRYMDLSPAWIDICDVLEGHLPTFGKENKKNSYD